MRRAAWSPDGSRIATGGDDGTVHAYDADNEVMTLGDNRAAVTAVAYSPDGSRLLTADGDAIRVRDASTGAMLLTLAAGGKVTSAAWSPDGTHIVAGRSDGTCRVWAAVGDGNAIRTSSAVPPPETAPATR